MNRWWIPSLLLPLGLALGCAGPLAKKKITSERSIAYWTAEGAVMLTSEKGVCVAPPSQGVRQMDYNGAIGGSYANVSVNASGSIDHSTARLFEQTSALLFFQFAMYRLCEMYINGAIESAEYRQEFNKLVEVATALVQAEIERTNAEAALAQQKANLFGPLPTIRTQQDPKPEDPN